MTDQAPFRHIEWTPQPTILGAQPAERPTTDSIAIVVGGSEFMKIELVRALGMCHATGNTATVYLINDAIHEIGLPAIGVTLHPYDRKIGEWIRRRSLNKHPALTEVWADRPGPFVTNRAPDPRGSSGLFAIEIALNNKGHKKVLLCGVPMTPYGGHFLRKRPWNHATAWRVAWLPKREKFKRHVRSFSGWTAEQFGLPDEAFMEKPR